MDGPPSNADDEYIGYSDVDSHSYSKKRDSTSLLTSEISTHKKRKIIKELSTENASYQPNKLTDNVTVEARVVSFNEITIDEKEELLHQNSRDNNESKNAIYNDMSDPTYINKQTEMLSYKKEPNKPLIFKEDTDNPICSKKTQENIIFIKGEPINPKDIDHKPNNYVVDIHTQDKSIYKKEEINYSNTANKLTEDSMHAKDEPENTIYNQDNSTSIKIEPEIFPHAFLKIEHITEVNDTPPVKGHLLAGLVPIQDSLNTECSPETTTTTKSGDAKDTCQGSCCDSTSRKEGCLFCDLCMFKTSCSTRLQLHMNTHTSEDILQCNLCDYSTSIKELLKIHLNTHSDIDTSSKKKMYHCDVCDYKTPKNSNLKIHKKTHTGERNHHCHICDFKTAQKSNLNSHLKKHRMENFLHCSVCEYKSLRNDHLERHMMLHTGEKPLHCEFCDYKTSSKGNLNSHLKVHTGERNHPCTLCDYRAGSSTHLKRHLQRHKKWDRALGKE